MVDEPWSTIAIDTIGPLPADDQGMVYIIVAIDCFSRFVELKSTKDVTAKSAAAFILEIAGRYGMPKCLRSDNGGQYAAKIIDELLHLMSCGRGFTILYRPQSNGIVERVNAEVLRHLQSLVMDLRVKSQWSLVLPFVQRIINASYHSSIGTVPSRMLFGDRIHLDRYVFKTEEGDGPKQCVVEDYIQELVAAQNEIIQRAVQFQESVVQKRMSKGPQTDVVPNVDDHVLVSYPDRPPSKLTPQWRGPLVVTAVSGSLVTCQDLTTLAVQQYHISRLKKYDSSRTLDAVEVAQVDRDEWEVEAIVEHLQPTGKKKPKKDWSFKVRWRGFDASEDSWLPFSEVRDLAALDVYLKAHPELRL
jgi:hypothetical protein